MNKSEKPSIKDIARKAGVSIGTVDRVLHNRGQVSDTTRQKVQGVIDDLGYKPNLLARSLASQRNFKIGVLLPFSSNKNDYWYYPATGIQKAAEAYQYFDINFVEAYFDLHDPQSFHDKAAFIQNARLDGLITAPIFKNELQQLLGVLDSAGTPYVLLDSDLEKSNRKFFIGQDPHQSGRAAGQLISLTLPENATDVMILHFNSARHENPTIQRRIEGFTQYFQEYQPGMKLSTYSVDSTNNAELTARLSHIFENHHTSDAVFVPDSKIHLLSEFLQSYGGKERKLAGFDLLEKNAEYLKKGYIDFLISQQPVRQGYQALEHLLKVLNQAEEGSTTHAISIDIITSENIRYYEQEFNSTK